MRFGLGGGIGEPPRRARALTDLGHAAHSHDGRFLLPVGKCMGLLAVGVHASEDFAVCIENLGFIVMVFAPLVSAESRALSV
jgi:hypothetical protein